MKVNILEAKNRLSELIRAVHAGEEVIIANRGAPVARLTAINESVAPGPPANKHPTGSAAGILELMAYYKANPLPPESRRAPEEIDAEIKALRDDWTD